MPVKYCNSRAARVKAAVRFVVAGIELIKHNLNHFNTFPLHKHSLFLLLKQAR